MGLLSDYARMTDVEPSAFGFDTPNGTYEFETTSYEVKEVTTSKGDEYLILEIGYRLTNENGKDFPNFKEAFFLPSDPENPTEQEMRTLSNLKSRLLALGFSEEDIDSDNIEEDDIVGITGGLTLVTTKNKKSGKEYQNVRNFKIDEEGPAPKKAAPAPKKAAPARRSRAAAPAEQEEAAPAAPTRKARTPRTKAPVAAVVVPDEEPEYDEDGTIVETPAVLAEEPKVESDDDLKERIRQRRLARQQQAPGQRQNPLDTEE